MREDPLRLFIGVSLPTETQEKLASLEDELRKFVPHARWVRRENLHLTLKFLGYCDSSRVEEIDQKIREAAEEKGLFSFVLSGLGAFPSLKKARVLWVGVGEGAEQFIELAKNVDTSLEKLSFERENRLFHPHITLARLKIPSLLDEARLINLSDLIPQNQLKAGSITLFQSKLTPAGAKYSKVTENLLKNT